MLAITEHPTGVLEIIVQDVVDGDDIAKLEQVLDRFSLDEASINAVLNMTDARDFSGKAMVQDPASAERLLCQFDKLGRIAVVTESETFAGMVQAVKGLMPDGAMVRFAPTAQQDAHRFAAHLS
jgi:hypothetical protein